uniref:Type II inositol 1,4,5-trisphosphate 5-phosphatase n=3 Tax=Lygus hesperus TaxID=30085 RepID=A0A0A9YPQ7_LYGHE
MNPLQWFMNIFQSGEPISSFISYLPKTDDLPRWLHVATWNVNGQNPPDNLYKLLGQRNPTTPEPDVVVLGLQEVTITPQFLYSDKWSKQVDDILSSSYTKVGTEAMVGVIMNIYIKKDHQWALGQVEGSTVKTGFGGLYGNKGAVLISFSLYEKRFTFINCHLPAHDDGLEKRIEDYHTIESRRSSKCSQSQDYIFWIGDLNFRIGDRSLGANRIQHMVQKGRQDEVLEKDELMQLMSTGQIFRGWSEPPISFRPTFKIIPERGTYNLKRRPAWTDRLLFMSETGQDIVNTYYNSSDDFLDSDHKPVVGLFDVWVDLPARHAFD